MTDPDFNASQRNATQRQQVAMLRRIDLLADPPHWRWLGSHNMFQSPVLRVGADVVSAAHCIYELWKRRRPSPAAKPCTAKSCVHPDHWRT